jgi:hypothetical protein
MTCLYSIYMYGIITILDPVGIHAFNVFWQDLLYPNPNPHEH